MASRVVYVALVLATALIVSAAIYTSLLVLERQAALREASRYNATWLVSQAALEVSRFTTALGGFRSQLNGTDINEVQLRFDIVLNRVKVLSEGDQGQFIQGRPDLKATLSELEQALQSSSTAVDSLRAGQSVEEIYVRFTPLLAKLNRLAASVHERGVELAGSDLDNLERLGWTFTGLLVTLILISFGLIILTRRNYTMLVASYAEVRQLAHDLRVNNTRFDAALNNMSQGLCMGIGTSLVVCNDRFRNMFGLASPVSLGTPISKVFQHIGEPGASATEFAELLLTRQTDLITNQVPAKIVHEDGERSLTMTHEPMADGGWVTTYEDTTEQRAAEARITFMANHDILTGLPNRFLFRECLSRALASLNTTGQQIAVLCLDLDRFKQVNDTLGHPSGDLLLKIVADRLRRCTSDTDMVARLGGDEFVVFCLASDGRQASTLVAERIIAALGAAYDLDGHRAVISASVGIALATEGSGDADMLVKQADVALYKAKTEGRSNFRFFAPPMETELAHRREIELEMSSALQEGAFELYLQPLFALRSHSLVGFEALLRWNHPVRGQIPPSEFIPIAEDTGFIVQLGHWVLQQACLTAAAWPEPKKIAVNLSPAQFGPDLIGAVGEALSCSGLAPHLLELEITETVLLENDEAVLQIMRALKELGVRTVLDDFGTGYSALSYLRMFPFDKLKIDQAFVREMCEREDSRSIVSSVVQLATALGMTTTAEGVESLEQVTALRAMKCDEAQGFFLGVPQPADQVPHWPVRRLIAV